VRLELVLLLIIQNQTAIFSALRKLLWAARIAFTVVIDRGPGWGFSVLLGPWPGQ